MLFYHVVRGIGAFIARLLIRIKVQGLENIPTEGSCVIAANHIHALDPVFLAIAVRRPICFMAKEELMSWPVIGRLIRRLGVFPVKRGKVDMQAVRHALGILNRGAVLGIFPEGTRSKSGEIQEAFGGAALLSMRTGATLIPVALAGDYRLGGSIRINVGRAISISAAIPGKPTSEERNAATSLLMQRIAELKRQLSEESW
jgi:1-acyl-sn-glycerol-3-phosphate acyltransferase